MKPSGAKMKPEPVPCASGAAPPFQRRLPGLAGRPPGCGRRPGWPSPRLPQRLGNMRPVSQCQQHLFRLPWDKRYGSGWARAILAKEGGPARRQPPTASRQKFQGPLEEPPVAAASGSLNSSTSRPARLAIFFRFSVDMRESSSAKPAAAARGICSLRFPGAPREVLFEIASTGSRSANERSRPATAARSVPTFR